MRKETSKYVSTVTIHNSYVNEYLYSVLYCILLYDSVTYQKSVLFCGMVLVWFWYGFGMVLVWFGLEPNQNHTKNIPKTYQTDMFTHVRT